MIADLPATRQPPGTRQRSAGRRLRLTPARCAILAFGVPVAAALIGWTGFSLMADAGGASYPVAYTIPIDNGQLAMNLSGSDLTIQGDAATGTAHLTGTVHYSLVRPHISVGTSFHFGCRIPTGYCSLNSTVDVPSRTAMTVDTAGGDLSATNLTSNVTLSTGGGNLTVTDITGAATLHTNGGDLTATQLTGDINLSTGGGNVNAAAIDAPTLSADSNGGDVKIVFTQSPRNVQVSSGGGNVTIVLPPGTASYDVTTSTGGGNLTDSATQNSASPNKITAASSGGNITIERAS